MTIQITELPNGLRVATDTMSEAESVVTGAWVGVGTRHEPWKASGVAHLVEHMMFKGTKKRTAYALSSAIENKGGELNALTSREATVYYARVLPEETETATDVIADMLRNSIFAAKELDRERLVVIQEIGRDLDSPEDYAFNLMHKLALPNQKIGRPILGSAEAIARMPRATLIDYVSRHYVGANMVLVAAGKISHETFLKMVKKNYQTLSCGNKPKEDKARVSFGEKRLSKQIEQVHLILGFAGPGYRAGAPYYATQILSLILGGSASSRLFQKVREKRGLVYTINSGHAGFCDAGIFQIYAGTDPKRLGELIPVVCDELKIIKKNITQGELTQAKAQIRADLLMGRESVMRRADVLGRQILAYGRPISAEKTLKQYLAVTIEDAQNIARKLFARKPILTALGPLAELEEYKKISERLA
jgi:predicted Zn-dependent peptidase